MLILIFSKIFHCYQLLLVIQLFLNLSSEVPMSQVYDACDCSLLGFFFNMEFETPESMNVYL